MENISLRCKDLEVPHLDDKKKFNFKNKMVLIGTYCLIVFTSLVYAIIVVPMYTTNEMIPVYVFFALSFLFTLWILYKVSTSDPGYIQRGTLSKEEYFNTPNTLNINGIVIELKYCDTCKIKRPPRSFHCGLCDSCISVHDHHCPFIGNCVGEKNLYKFFLFLLSVFLHCINVFLGTIFIFLRNRELNKDWDYKNIICILILLFSAVFGVTMLFMIFYQSYFISTGKTTNECLRKKYDTDLFDEGCCKNWKKTFNPSIV